jgi:ketosteroid isomerase-like protein
VCQHGHRALVETVYARLNEIDLGVVALFDPEVEWHWGQATPGQSVFRGHGQVRDGLLLWRESWDDFRMEPEELIEEGEYVFAMTRYRAHGAGSGIEVDTVVAHLFRITDGRLARWWMFGDAEKARRRFLAGDRPD